MRILLIIYFYSCLVTELQFTKNQIFFISLQTPTVVLPDQEQNYNQNRIVGGFPALAGQLPWQVFVNATSLCGGVLIGRQWILTAGSCIRG